MPPPGTSRRCVDWAGGPTAIYLSKPTSSCFQQALRTSSWQRPSITGRFWTRSFGGGRKAMKNISFSPTPTPLAGERLRPLGHVSVDGYNRASIGDTRENSPSCLNTNSVPQTLEMALKGTGKHPLWARSGQPKRPSIPRRQPFWFANHQKPVFVPAPPQTTFLPLLCRSNLLPQEMHR